jgi:hypothetical protein
MKKLRNFLALGFVVIMLQSASHGALLTSAVWTTKGIPASGNLDGNVISLTSASFDNAGDRFTFNWGGMPFAAGYTTTSNSAVAIGYTDGTSTTSIAFSESINNLALWFNFIDPGTVFDFSGLNWSFVAGNNASRSGSTVVSTGSNSPNDGFLINVDGSFGPSSPLSFTIDQSGGSAGDTAGFTLSGTAPPLPAVPEPGTWAAAALLVGGAAFMRWRRRQTA